MLINISKVLISTGLDEFSASPRLNQYENGIHTPSLSILKQIAKVLDLPVAYFYAEDSGLAEVIKKYHRNH